MIARHDAPAAPPRDALLKDRRGDVWAGLGERDEWVCLAGAGGAVTATWPELVAAYGLVDVMVWRGTITAPARVDSGGRVGA